MDTHASSTIDSEGGIRCAKCNKLIAKGLAGGLLELKCLRCGTMNFVFEQMKEQVIVTDPKGIILFANNAVSSTTGYTIEEIIGAKPSLWGKQMSPEFYQNMWKIIRDEKKSIHVFLTNKRKTGELYKAELKVTPVLDTDGEVRFYVGIERALES